MSLKNPADPKRTARAERSSKIVEALATTFQVQNKQHADLIDATLKQLQGAGLKVNRSTVTRALAAAAGVR